MSESREDLKVPKDRVAVELALRSGERREVQLFLAEHEAHAFRHENVSDLLEDARDFVPGYSVEEAAWLFFSKGAIGWLALARAGDEEELELFEEDRPAEVRLCDGSTLRGELLYSPPRGGSRTVDHLNEAGRFFTLYETSRIYFIDKAFVEWVREREPEERD